MKRTIITITAAVLLSVAGCNRTPAVPSHDELLKSIDSIEKPLMEAAQFENVDTLKGRQLVDLYVQFADAYPDDSLTASYLHKAASVCNGMGLIDEMVTYYDRVIDNYPDYELLDECYYSKGIALDNAGRKEEARKAYEDFLEVFHDHFLADDIRKALPLLDLSDEMLIKYLNSNS